MKKRTAGHSRPNNVFTMFATLLACTFIGLAGCDDDSTGFECTEIDDASVTRIAPNGDTVGVVDLRDWTCTPLQTLCPMPAMPNPAGRTTTIRFILADSTAPVTIELRDRCGVLIQTVVDRGEFVEGENEVVINTSGRRAGMYRVHIIAWASGGVVVDETTGELIIAG